MTINVICAQNVGKCLTSLKKKKDAVLFTFFIYASTWVGGMSPYNVELEVVIRVQITGTNNIVRKKQLISRLFWFL